MKSHHILYFSIALLVIALPLHTVTADPIPDPAADQVLQSAWERAREAGAYHFNTRVVQTTHPAPALANVGRGSREEVIYLDGEADLPQRTLDMRLHQNGGSLLKDDSALEVHIARDKARARLVGGPWQTIDNFADAFAPGSDPLAYLAGAKNVRELEQHTPSIPGRKKRKFVNGLAQFFLLPSSFFFLSLRLHL